MNIDLQNRSPKLDFLPDDRLRVTRYADVLQHIPRTPAALAAAGLWKAWGTVDETYPQCRLIAQNITGQSGEFRKPVDEPPKLVSVYEEIPATAEQRVGEAAITVNQFSYLEVAIEYIQFSATAPTHQVPGVTAAPSPFTTCILREEIATDDGTLRHIKRIFVAGGQLDQFEELKFGGRLKLRTLRYLNEEPVTPAGYTLVTKTIQFINGLRVYSYGYANGTVGDGGGGIISQETEYRVSPDQGETGVTVTTITYITDLTVDTNPITGPVGSELISITYTDEGGFRTWRGVYAFGQGIISSEVATREGGKLKQYDITSLNAIPSAPAATIGGTVTLVQANVRNGTESTNGTLIYDYRWLEGFGEVARNVDYGQSRDQGVTGVTRTTIRTLTAIGATIQPAALSGSTKVGEHYETHDGYASWTVIFAKGVGTVTTTVDVKNGGKLILYRIIALGASPSAPAATIGGTVTLIGTDTREADGFQIFDLQFAEGIGEIARETQYNQSSDLGVNGVTVVTIRALTALGASDPTSSPGAGYIKASFGSNSQDGYLLWTVVWAKGVGLVVTEVNIQIKDALVVYRRVSLGAAPTTPTQTIGGTPTLFETSVREDQGGQVFDYRWSEGDGQSGIETTAQDDGALVYAVTTLTLAAATPAYPGSGTGYLLKLEQTPANGYFRNQAIYKKAPATITLKRMKDFAMPGLASFSGNDLIISPPNRRLIEADEEISYGTTQNADVPYSVEYGAYLRESYIRTFNNGVGESRQTSLGYILAGAYGVSGTDDYYKGMLCDSFEATLNSSSPSSRPSGLTVVDKENQIYLVDMAGTVVYRRTKVSYTFP